MAKYGSIRSATWAYVNDSFLRIDGHYGDYVDSRYNLIGFRLISNGHF